jgi:hypothetical protein
MPAVKKTSTKKGLESKKPLTTVKKKPLVKAVAKKDDGLTDRQRRVYEYLKKQTAAAFGSHFKKTPEPKPEKKPSEKATKLAKLTPSFGGYATQLNRVLEVILGEKIPGSVDIPDPARTGGKELSGSVFISGACIVPVGNSNRHDYPIGKVAMVLHSRYCGMMRNGGGTGNSMTQHIKELRLPTDAELRAFVAANCERIIDKLRLMVV